MDCGHGEASLLQPAIQLKVHAAQQGPKGGGIEQQRLA
jgi:hypothetical protein